MKHAPSDEHIGFLDGVRGLMALWVFCGHLHFVAGASYYLLRTPNLAVDVFMFLSGFLMAWHWHGREKHFPSFTAQTTDFYIRRFFRIAPLYYLLVTFGICLHDRLGSVYLSNPLVHVSNPGDISPDVAQVSPGNFLLHYSFLFGLVPAYSSNTYLPDWSLSLEAQFYAAFPLLVVLFRRLGEVVMVLACLVLTAGTNLICQHATPGGWLDFPSPSFLFLKLSVFITGILLARFLQGPRERGDWRRLLLLYGLSLLFVAKVVAVLLLLILAQCVWRNRITAWSSRLLSSKVAVFAADTSYGVYLSHWLIIAPILAVLLHHTSFVSLSAPARFALAFAACAGPVYGVAYLLHILVERPGIRLGKMLLRSRRVSSVPARV